MGGHVTEVTLTRPVGRIQQLSYYPRLLARVTQLHAQGEKLTAIAQQLNAEGWLSARRCQPFNEGMVKALLHDQGLLSSGRRRSNAIKDRAADEWTVAELAHQLDIPRATLFNWLRQGKVQGRQVLQSAHRVWLIQADELQQDKLRELRSHSRACH